jgi:hypothetical protein
MVISFIFAAIFRQGKSSIKLPTYKGVTQQAMNKEQMPAKYQVTKFKY